MGRSVVEGSREFPTLRASVRQVVDTAKQVLLNHYSLSSLKVTVRMDDHEFTATILEILDSEFGIGAGRILMDASPLLQYINIKTRSANRGSKARGSFANLYAIYVLVEDYIHQDFHESGSYGKYGGAQFSALFTRQRELPFGNKLQNHALNSRLNEEYKKFFVTTEFLPILRDLSTSRYWFNEALLRCKMSPTQEVNIAPSIIRIIDAYVQAKRDAFELFMAACQRLATIGENNAEEGVAFVTSLLAPTADARIFEIVSFAILKAHYGAITVWLGWEKNSVEEQPLVLFKTGRTNANDSGIDFVMRPLGRFYQVTETLDLRKYFLDIDKIQRFPITFLSLRRN
ncbi:MAG: restriction endonuclease [Actinomycetota bacterium]|jgi:hypothetical protein|nr:restriction endonuclease [Actinomycetota bacterium]